MDFGREIKKLRKKRMLTIKDLSERTGLSNGYLSNIERNLNSPTIETLHKIVDALSISLVEFFQGVQKLTLVVKKDDRVKMVETDDRSVLFELLSPSKEQKMESVLLTLKPGAQSGESPHSHKGDDFGFIIQGKLLNIVGDEEYILEGGDSIYFDSTIPHYHKNIGDIDSISIWTVTHHTY